MPLTGDAWTAPSRRWSGEWSDAAPPQSPLVDVLIPALDRPAELAVTPAGLAAQDDRSFSVSISDQSEDGAA